MYGSLTNAINIGLFMLIFVGRYLVYMYQLILSLSLKKLNNIMNTQIKTLSSLFLYIL